MIKLNKDHLQKLWYSLTHWSPYPDSFYIGAIKDKFIGIHWEDLDYSGLESFTVGFWFFKISWLEV